VLIRPGAQPGPAWMRNISDALADPDRSHKVMMPFWAFFLIYMLVFTGLTHFVGRSPCPRITCMSPPHTLPGCRSFPTVL
jgi:hypothetical protein